MKRIRLLKIPKMTATRMKMSVIVMDGVMNAIVKTAMSVNAILTITTNNDSIKKLFF